MAKKAKSRAPKKKLVRKQRSRVEREHRMERILVWGTIAVAVIVVGLLGYGLISEKLIKARRPVAIVDGTSVTLADFKARARFKQVQIRNQLEYWSQQRRSIDPSDENSQFWLDYVDDTINNLQTQWLMVGEEALDELVEEELVRRETERRGIAVAVDEVDQQIEQFFGYDRASTESPLLAEEFPLTSATSPTLTESITVTTEEEAPPTPTPMTEEGYRTLYTDYRKLVLRPQGISEKQFRSVFEAALIREKLLERFMEEGVSIEEDQVELRQLVAYTETVASELAARLDAGEDLLDLASELEMGAAEEITGTEEITATHEPAGYGGELGWYTRDALVQGFGAELAEIAFDLEVGAHSQPVLSEDGGRYTILEVVGHEMRELDEWDRQQRAEELFEEWLVGQQGKVERIGYDPEEIAADL